MTQHRRATERAILGLAISMVGATPNAASAYSITVDGDDSDWVLDAPTVANTGHIGRDGSSRGGYVWTDPTADARTDLANPETVADIRRFEVTADDDFLYFLVEMGSSPGPGITPPMVQIAVDTDRVAGSGQVFFGGSADTSVASEAAWEYLIQTRFGSGNASPYVYTASFIDMAGSSEENIQGLSGTIEIAIEWSTLGFTSVPADPVRFTVASFRSTAFDTTVDIPSASDALDAVTNYGDPAGSAGSNTLTEVSDLTADYFFDVWFDGVNGDPVAPLLISEILYDASTGTAGEWVELVNRTAMALDLEGFALTDEESMGGTEGAAAFPNASIVSAGAFIVVANDASDYSTTNGFAADYEFQSTTSGVPDMSPLAEWSSGTSPALANAGDEVLLLDPFFTILDAVSFESGSYPGVVAASAASTDDSITRVPFDEDRNDGSIDFLAGVPSPGVEAITLVSIPAAWAVVLTGGLLAGCTRPQRRQKQWLKGISR